MAKERLTQSEIDGVQYRRAKLWQIILVAFNAVNGMAMYFLIGLASYSASIGYGIATLVVGGLLQNSPSDGRERSVGSALILTEK